MNNNYKTYAKLALLAKVYWYKSLIRSKLCVKIKYNIVMLKKSDYGKILFDEHFNAANTEVQALTRLIVWKAKSLRGIECNFTLRWSVRTII